MYKSRVGRFGRISPRSKASRSSSRQSLRGRFELLEPRLVLSVPAPTTVGIGAPVLVAFNDPGAVAGTTFTAQSSNGAALTATVLQTSEMLKMEVHTVNADGSVGVSGEMDFLLLDQYAPNNIAHVTSLVDSGFYNGLDFHRIIQDFMDQGGDPLGTGSGGSGFNGAQGQTVDDEFNVDLRFTSSGILAMANSGPDTNDCQFFITNAAYRSLDYGYTIIGKLVAGDALRQAIAGVPVEANSSGEVSQPINPPIIDSVTIVPDVQYGLLMLKSGSAAAAGQTSTVTVTASNHSSVTITASDGTQQSSLGTTLATDTPSPNDRPAFITSIPDVNTTMNQAITFSVPVTEGDAGVPLTYGALEESGNSNISVTYSGTGPTDGSVTVTPSGDVVGVYDLLVGVWATSNGGSDYDSQHTALFISPAAPASLSIATAGVTAGGTTAINNGLTFAVTGAVSGLTVAVYADGGSTPIGTAVVSSSDGTADVTTTVPLADGVHTFTVEQFVSYADTTVGNRTIPAGNLYSVASASTVSFTVDAPPTATANLSDVTNTGDGATFVVTYTNAGDTIALSTIDDNNVLVTGPNSFSQLATLLSATPNTDGSQVVATYRIDAPGGAWDSTNLGTYTATMQANQVSDSHGNFVAAGVLLTFNPSDLISPSVTIDLAAGQAATTNVSPINFTVTFSEAVTDFASAGVTLGGTAAGTLAATVTNPSGDQMTYNVAVSGMTGDGTVTITLAAGAAHDAAGNPSLASTSTDNSVTYDTTAPTVTIDQAAPQKNPTNALEIMFVVVFSEPVAGFTGSDVTVSGTAGATTAVVSAWPGSSTEYTVTVSGMTGDGTVVANLLAGAVQDTAGNPSAASTSTGTDNSVTYEGTRPTVTINQASTQADPTGSSTIHFTVVFSEAVSDFVTGDVTFGGTVVGNLTATVTAASSDGTTYDVAVVGMAGNGTLTATVAAYEAHDAAGNGNMASTSTDNTVHFVLAQLPTFTLTMPTSGTYNAGQTVSIAWKGTNIIANTVICLCYDTDAVWGGGKETWITFSQAATAGTGYGTYQWNTTGMAPGTYYIGGYLWSGGKPIYSHLTQPITILGPAAPTFALTAPTSGTYAAGQSVTIAWKDANVPAGAVVCLCYDKDAVWGGAKETWITFNQTPAASGTYGEYQWNTTGLAPGTYYVGGYLWANGKPIYSHLTQAITISQPTFTLTAPTSGAYNVGQNVTIAWKDANVPTGAVVCLCYDTDAVWGHGKETWITFSQTAATGYGEYTWDTAGVAPGTYYIGGYLWSNGTPTYSHLTQPITLAALLTLAAPAFAPEQPLPAADVLQTQSELTPIVAAAIQRWAGTAGSQVLAGVSVQIADLPGNVLGETIGDTILINRDAAGYGWFIDPTPSDDSEFTPLANHTMVALPQTAAQQHVDLLTVVMHEMGHVLGYSDDLAGDLMNDTLPLGVRRTDVVDGAFATY